VFQAAQRERQHAVRYAADQPEQRIEAHRTFVHGYFDILTSDIERLSGRAPQSFREVLTATLSKGGAP
jgi:hypothetical protein